MMTIPENRIVFSCNKCQSICYIDSRSRSSSAPLYAGDRDKKCFKCGDQSSIRIEIYGDKYRDLLIDLILT